MEISFHFGKTRIGAKVIDNRQERKHPRFRLECPVYIRFKADSFGTEVVAVSKDVSIGGLLVRTAAMIPERTPVTFIISVRGDQSIQPIYLAGEGEVIRVKSSGADFMIAVECKTPITQLEDHPLQV